MVAEKLDLKLNKGDTGKFKIKLFNQDKAIIVLAEEDMIYFTVKENYEVVDYIFQKKLNDGIEYSDEDQCYHFTINPEDTDALDYKDYVYDVQVVRNETREGSAQVKEKYTVLRGNFKITEVATFVENE